MQANECAICYEPVTEWAVVTECHHHCCLKCALRYKFISNKSGCPICLKETADEEMIFQMVRVSQVPELDRLRYREVTDEMYLWGGGVWVPAEDVEVIEEILSRKCQLCRSEFYDAETLISHYPAKHHRFLCQLCVRYRCEFASEYVVYSDRELAAHQRGSGAIAEHPLCKFCRERFYCQDMFIKHSRRVHELCYLCDRLGKKDQYYKNYAELEHHFQRKHYTCPEQRCIDSKCYAFIDQMALTLHTQKAHPVKKEAPVALHTLALEKKQLPKPVKAPAPKIEKPAVQDIPEHLKRDELVRKREFRQKYSTLITAHYAHPAELISLTARYNESELELPAYVAELRQLVGDSLAIELVERLSPYLLSSRRADIEQHFPEIRRGIEFAPHRFPPAEAGAPSKSGTPTAAVPPTPSKSASKSAASSKSIWEHFSNQKFNTAPSLASKLPRKPPGPK